MNIGNENPAGIHEHKIMKRMGNGIRNGHLEMQESNLFDIYNSVFHNDLKLCRLNVFLAKCRNTQIYFSCLLNLNIKSTKASLLITMH